jgi:hypothetical protein
MSHAPASGDAFDQAVAEIPSCTLDDAGKREQRARYALLASSVARIERQPETVLIYFDHDLNRHTLQQALSVERECCPFFTFAFDEQSRRLRATVTDTNHIPALDAVADALEPTGQRTSQSRLREGGRRSN